ncbi:phosphoglycolate phosphatase [Paraferrimonas sp. SM1919]|uniref:phosphoglycolate phosphatase n=1 Tax=Paraferrimonas sp. SM1919 TaxID=2662263 RepID=UPI0013D580D9|nr:phosphoglycolate phosphatase [Paraferrimonas sp. SM1919]
MNINIKAIAFDLDGTLVDSVPDLTAALNDTLKEHNLTPCELEQVHSWIGNGARVLLTRALTFALAKPPTEQLLAELLPKFLDYYDHHLEQATALFDGVAETLDSLQKMGLTLAVVTNKPYRFTPKLLEALGIAHHFSYVLGADSLERMKPDPLPLQHLLAEIGINNTQLLMVGDSKNDILCGQAAAVDTIAVTYGYNYGECITDSNPNHICQHFNQILEVLKLNYITEC